MIHARPIVTDFDLSIDMLEGKRICPAYPIPLPLPPNPPHHQLKPIHNPRPLHRSRIMKLLRLIPWPIDRHGLLQRVDQPRNLRPIGNPHLHLLSRRLQTIRPGPELDHEIRTNWTVLILVRIRPPTLLTHPRRIRAPDRTIRQNKPRARNRSDTHARLRRPSCPGPA